jgi:Holliday junction resolvasome RuvABC endonuclease subunit
MRLLALDLGTSTGWAVSIPEMGVESGTQIFDVKRGESPGMRFFRFRRWLVDMIENSRPELIVFEIPHHRGGAATDVLVGMKTHIEEICAEAGIEHQGIHFSSLKKFATGSGRALKKDMIVAAKKLFPYQDIKTDDQADALCVLAWAIDRFEVTVNA